jgi:hypothetical protein
MCKIALYITHYTSRITYYLLIICLFPTFLWAQEVIKSTAQDRQSLQLVIYNQNFALVQEVRQIKLPEGKCKLYLADIPSKIEPETVIGKSLFAEESLQILFQKYLYDLITPQNLLKRYVGKRIKVFFENPLTGNKEMTDALLLACAPSGPVCEINGQVYLHCPGEIILPSLPEGLFPSPTLFWEIYNRAEGEHLIQLTYLTHDINWQADYVLILTQKDQGDLTGWIRINNQSGADYNQARVLLLAGELHKTLPARRIYRSEFVAQKSMSPQVKETPFFEYHLYRLNQPLTVKNNQQVQVQFEQQSGIGVQQEFVYKGSSYYYRSYYDTPISQDKVKVYLRIANTKENKLGLPLPPGKIRVYQEDKEGNAIFIGEDKITPTPVGKELKLAMGVAFDIIAQRRQNVYRRLSPTVYEIGWEILFQNKKNYPVTINVTEEIPGDWEVINANFEYQKAGAHQLVFVVPVAAEGETKIKYVVRVKD